MILEVLVELFDNGIQYKFIRIRNKTTVTDLDCNDNAIMTISYTIRTNISTTKNVYLSWTIFQCIVDIMTKAYNDNCIENIFTIIEHMKFTIHCDTLLE